MISAMITHDLGDAHLAVQLADDLAEQLLVLGADVVDVSVIADGGDALLETRADRRVGRLMTVTWVIA